MRADAGAQVLHGARRTALSAGHSVLVLGCGAVGLLACATAHLFGASHVTAVDIDPLRCEFAEKEGFANKTLVLPRLPKPETPDAGLENAATSAKQIVDKCSPAPEGYDIVFECTGVAPCIALSVHVSMSSIQYLALDLILTVQGCESRWQGRPHRHGYTKRLHVSCDSYLHGTSC